MTLSNKPSSLVISVPKLEPHRPPISTGIIAQAIECAGYPVEALDLNIKLYNRIDNNLYWNLDSVWEGTRKPSLNEYKQILACIKSYNNNYARNHNIMISVFGNHARPFTKILCLYIRKHYPDKQIVLGGQGVLSNALGDKKPFGQVAIDEGLADAYISGEGEIAVVEYLKTNYNYEGINSSNFKQIDELNQLPFPNYKYFKVDEYDYLDGKEVFVVASRGCVRKCTYCDVGRYWPKYRYRSGQNIADELIFHYETQGINQFYFTDSLVNGSLKAFRDMCEKLAHYNTQYNAGFKWKGQYIFRPKNQTPESDFEIMRKAGADSFFVGVETGSDKIRWEMDKKFSNEDIDYQLEQFSKHGLKVMFLMLLGYLTETIEDHEETMKMFPRWQKYVADGTISGCDLGSMLVFLPETPIANMIDSHEVYFFNNGNTGYLENQRMWQSASNPDLTVYERIRRRLETHEQAIKYNWPIWRGEQRLQVVKSLAQEYLKFAKDSVSMQQQQLKKDGVKLIQLVPIQDNYVTEWWQS